MARSTSHTQNLYIYDFVYGSISFGNKTSLEEEDIVEVLSEKAFWNDYWVQETKGDPDEYIFNGLFQQYLPYGGSYLEIGCAPGSTMVNFHRNFGYTVTGIDYSSVDIVRQTMTLHGVSTARVIEADFTTLELQEQFDVVGSYGFVEHFVDYPDIIRRHSRLVKPGGYLVIELPNIRYFNWLMYRIVDPKLLSIHNLDVMDPVKLKRPIEDDFDILFCNYYKTCFLFFDSNNPQVSQYPWRRRMLKMTQRIFEKLRIDNLPNRVFSPYIILIAKKHLT